MGGIPPSHESHVLSLHGANVSGYDPNNTHLRDHGDEHASYRRDLGVLQYLSEVLQPST